MATTKIHPIKVNIHGASKYFQDPLKTENGDLVSAFMCNENDVQKSFEKVLNNERATHRKVIARHIIQSFKPGEVETDVAHKIGLKLAEEHLQGRYQYVVATHVDKRHIHNHILFNNVSFIDFKSYNSNKKSYHKIREISDNLCLEHGLDVIENNEKNKQFEDPHQSKGKYINTFRYQIRNDIDYALKKAIHLDEFKEIMAEKYEIKEGKHLAFKHKTNGQERFIRCRSLGYRYQETMLQLRIDTEFLDMKDVEKKPVPESYIKRVIDLTRNNKFHENPGLHYWGINHNNLAISQTIYRLHQLGIGSFKQLENFISQSTLSLENDKKELVKLEKKAIKLLGKKELLNKLEKELIENEAITVRELNLTSDKPNTGLENIIQSLINEGVFLESSLGLQGAIKETNVQYHTIKNDISKLNKSIEVENADLRDYSLIAKNYEVFFLSSISNQLHEYEERKR